MFQVLTATGLTLLRGISKFLRRGKQHRAIKKAGTYGRSGFFVNWKFFMYDFSLR